MLSIQSRSKLTRTCESFANFLRGCLRCVIPRNFYALRKCLSIVRPTSRHTPKVFHKSILWARRMFFIKHKAAVPRPTHYASSFDVSSSKSSIGKSSAGVKFEVEASLFVNLWKPPSILLVVWRRFVLFYNQSRCDRQKFSFIHSFPETEVYHGALCWSISLSAKHVIENRKSTVLSCGSLKWAQRAQFCQN